MKYIKQFSIIITVSFLGEVLHALLPLPIPASIYGLLLMLAGLCCHIIPMDGGKRNRQISCRSHAADVYSCSGRPDRVWDRISRFSAADVDDCSIDSTCEADPDMYMQRLPIES